MATTTVDVGNVTSTTLTDLAPDTTYQVRVRARDAAGNWSGWSTQQSFTTEVASTTRAIDVGAVTSTTVTGLAPSSSYTARIRARDAAGNWSPWSSTVPFTTTAAGLVVTPGRARPVLRGGGVQLDVTATPPGSETITSHSWAIVSGGGSLTGASTATPTYTAPSSGSGLVTIRDTVTASGGGTETADVVVSYHATIVAAENALPGTARATWDLASPNLGGHPNLQGFVDGFSVDKTGTVNFKIGQSDGAGWSAELYRLGYYGGDGARSYGALAPNSGQLAASQAQPAPADVDASTTLLSADCAAWSTTLTWTPPSWAPSGIYVLRLNRTGGGASHVMFVLRDDARQADLALMPSDSTWQAYNAWGGLGSSGQYGGNSLYYGVSVDQYNADCARFISYNRPIVNRGAADSGRSYGAVEWSNFFTAEYGFVRFLERNGHDVKYMACLDAAGDPTGTHLTGNGSTRGGVNAAIAVGHNEYWSDGMRSGWENAKAAGVSLFFSAGNEVFWRTVGSNADSDGRPRTIECQKSTIGGRGNTRPQWTGSWRDPDGSGKGGNAPENSLTGTIFAVNGPDLRSLQVPVAGGFSAQPMWRHTEVAALSSGTWSSPWEILGFEWDVPGPAFVSTTAGNFMAAPHPDVRYCSSATYSIASGLLLTDAGDVYDAAGTATHRLVVHPGGNGAMVFGAGTVNWALGLDGANTYQQGSNNTSEVLQQATINLLVDMGAPPTTLMSGLTMPTPVNWFLTEVSASGATRAVVTARGAARKVVMASGRCSAVAAARAAAVKRAPAAGAARAAIVGRGAAVKRATAAGSATAVAAGRMSTSLTRAATGSCTALASASGSMRHVTPVAGRSSATASARGVALRRTAGAGSSAVIAAGQAVAVKRVAVIGRSAGIALTVGAATQPSAPRPAFGRCAAVAICYRRPGGRTTPRPQLGTTTRPYAGVTPRP